MDLAEPPSGGGVSTKLWGRLGLRFPIGWQGTQSPPLWSPLGMRARPAALASPGSWRRAWSPQDSLGLWLLEHMGLSPCWQRGGFRTTQGRVHANGSQVSSGVAEASALGRCGVQFTLTGAPSPQDRPGGGAADGKGEEKWEEGRRFLCAADSWGVSVFTGPRTGMACCGKLWVFSQFLAGVVPWRVSSIFPGTVYWGNCPFPGVCSRLLFLWINWPRTCRFLSGLSGLCACFCANSTLFWCL